jgi:hypothetical protein
MQTKTTYTYIADDGKEFSDYEECKQYEEEQAKLKQYHVNVTFAAYGYVTVVAKSVEEAKKKAVKYIKEEYYPEDFDISEEPIAIVATVRS